MNSALSVFHVIRPKMLGVKEVKISSLYVTKLPLVVSLVIKMGDVSLSAGATSQLGGAATVSSSGGDSCNNKNISTCGNIIISLMISNINH